MTHSSIQRSGLEVRIYKLEQFYGTLLLNNDLIYVVNWGESWPFY